MGGIFKYVILSFGGILVAVSLMLIANLDQFASATIVSSEGSLTTDIGFDQTLDNDSSCAFWVYFGDTIALSGAEELADANYGGNGTAQITHSATLNATHYIAAGAGTVVVGTDLIGLNATATPFAVNWGRVDLFTTGGSTTGFKSNITLVSITASSAITAYGAELIDGATSGQAITFMDSDATTSTPGEIDSLAFTTVTAQHTLGTKYVLSRTSTVAGTAVQDVGCNPA